MSALTDGPRGDGSGLFDGGSTAFHERPSLPPVMRPTPRVHVAAELGAGTVHLAQLARVTPDGVDLFTWCGLKGSAVAFDPRVATCARCLRELHETVST